MGFTEKSAKEALEDYILGRPVTVTWMNTNGKREFMDLDEILGFDGNRFLVDMPDDITEPAPEEIIQAVHDTQEEPEDCPPPEQEQAKKELEEETVDSGDNSDRHLCMTCKYRGKKRPGRPKKGGPAARPGCDYYVITDRERGCDVEKCDKWEEE